MNNQQQAQNSGRSSSVNRGSQITRQNPAKLYKLKETSLVRDYKPLNHRGSVHSQNESESDQINIMDLSQFGDESTIIMSAQRTPSNKSAGMKRQNKGYGSLPQPNNVNNQYIYRQGSTPTSKDESFNRISFERRINRESVSNQLGSPNQHYNQIYSESKIPRKSNNKIQSLNHSVHLAQPQNPLTQSQQMQSLQKSNQIQQSYDYNNPQQLQQNMSNTQKLDQITYQKQMQLLQHQQQQFQQTQYTQKQQANNTNNAVNNYQQQQLPLSSNRKFSRSLPKSNNKFVIQR